MGKRIGGDRLDIEIAANLFHIDANLTSTRKRIQGIPPEWETLNVIPLSAWTDPRDGFSLSE